MKKSLKKTLGVVLSLSMIAGTVVLPAATAHAAEVGTKWQFDFGAEDAVETGWIAVTKDDVYAENASKSPVQYGFLGTDGHGDSYAQHIDGVKTKQGQNVTLKAGAKAAVAAASDDYLGVDKEKTVAASKIDGDYPIRFAMQAESDSYYNVKVKLTTFDQTEDAVATVFSERHHAIILEEAIEAGAEKEVEFNTTIQPFYLKDSGTTYNDDMLNVVVVGNNVAVESIVIEKVNPLPTVWMYNDSTGCDYQFDQPFFMLQNYGGTGSFLSKYFPKGIVAVNQGEGGLNAFDREHWGAANAHIGAGDYVYVQYGHNHKNDATVAPGVLGYLESIPKYYEKANSVGAYTLYVGPIDRHNAGQYDDSTNTWSSTLAGFSKAAKYYTEILITAGKTKADEFVTKAREESVEEVVDKETGRKAKVNISNSTYEWADNIIAQGITANGAKDVAFVDLNQPTLDWLEEVCETVKTIRGAENYERDATDYYFYSQKGGAVDGTHCNTAGADNTASFFFSEAKKTIALAADDEATANEKAIAAVQKDVLTPLVTDMRTAETNAYVVSEDIIKAGKAPNSTWPVIYVPSSLPALPLVIKDIQFDENGLVKSAAIYRQDAEKSIATYGILDIEIKNAQGETKGHIYSKQIEPDGANGSTFVYTAPDDFTRYDPSDLTLGETDTYTAVVRSASDPGTGSITIDVGENADTYSAVYEPTDVDTELLVDDMNYYNSKTGDDLTAHGWKFIGSGSGEGNHILTKDGDLYYTEIVANGGGSYYFWRDFDETEPGMTPGGKYMFEGSFNYTSGGGSVVSFATGTNDKNRSGTANLALFTIGANGAVTAGKTSTSAGSLNQGVWTDIRAIVDTDLGTLSVSVGGGEAAVISLNNYQTTSTTVEPAKLTQIHFGGDKMAYSYKVTNLHAAKLKSTELPKKQLAVSSVDTNMGTAAVTAVDDDAITEEQMIDGLSIGYASGKATVNSNSALEATFIEAMYTGTTLDEIKPTNVTLGASGGTQTIDVTEGSKLMLWDTISGMEPVLAAVTATGTVAPATKTSKVAPLNTVLTYTATPEDGYVFTGWSDGTSVVSTENPYSFRLRDDIILTAQFDKEGGVEDVASFNVKPDKTKMTVGTEHTVNIAVSDVLDANGNAVKYNAANDVTWTCAESDIQVAGGVVTIPAAYTTDTLKKTVTVSCTINGITKNVNLVLYNCEIFEDFTNVANFSDYISNSGTASSLFEILDTATDTTFAGMTSVGNGKVLVMGSNANGTGKNFAYEKDLGLSSYSTLKFGFEIEPHQIRSDGKNASVTLQFVDSEGTKVFDISVATGGSADAPANSSFNGTAINGFVKGNVISVDTELDFAAKTMKYKLTNSAGAVLNEGTATLTAKDLSKMSFKGDWQYGKFAIDNVYADYEPAV